MGFRRRFARRRRRVDRGRYVCGLCGARYDDRSVVICPKCRGFVVEADR